MAGGDVQALSCFGDLASQSGAERSRCRCLLRDQACHRALVVRVRVEFAHSLVLLAERCELRTESKDVVLGSRSPCDLPGVAEQSSGAVSSTEARAERIEVF